MGDAPTADVLAEFGVAVRALRAERRLSQEALADLAGVHRTYLGDIERGKRNVALRNIERLAIALDVTMSDLLLLTEHQRQGQLAE
jgi:transcriptional regulator with XRE-family HTH domain